MKVGKKLLSLMLGCTLLVSGITIPTKAAEGGRTVPHYDIRTAGGTWNGTQYKLTDGTLVTDAFFCDGTYTYYLQADGTPMTDKLTYHPDGEHIIYFDTNGHEVFTNFQYCPSVGYTCYFDSQGYIYKDQITFMNNKPYYLDGDGRMQQSGWFQFANGMDYGYANWDGTLMNNGFAYDPWGRIVFYHWNGMVARGLITDGATYYNMDMTDGHLIGTFPNTTGNTGMETEHTWDEGRITTEPTCTTEGVKTFTCKNCGETKTEIIEKTDHNYAWTYVSDGDYKVNKCSCGQETGERVYNLGNGVYGQWKDSMASDLMTCTNIQRGNTVTTPLDEIGNYLPSVISPSLNNTLSSQAKARALQCVSDYSHNGMITTDECLAKGYDNARSVSSAWMASGDHRDSSVYYLYTQGGTACLWYDSDGNGTMNYIWVLTLDY